MLSLDLIKNPNEIQSIADQLSKSKYLAFDTEFIRESTFYPKLEILQIATPDSAWLIDAAALTKKDLQPILNVFTDPKILKIVHAAHGDQECLLSAYDLLAAPLFDTAVGASLCGLGDNIGLSNLIRAILGIDLPKGYARTNWSKRPLPKPVLEYALLDVKHLIEAAQILFSKLEESGRKEWALELSSRFEERTLFEAPPEDIAKRLAQSGKFNIRDYSVLLELVKWREARVREVNVPRRWVAEDGVLIDLAKIKPTTSEQLQGFRGLSKGEAKPPHSERILNAVKRGQENKEEIPPEIKRRSYLQPSGEENLGLDLLRVCITLLSNEFHIAPKHIVTPQNLLPLLRLNPKSLEELKASELVSHQLGEKGLLGLFRFLVGETSLKMNVKRGAELASQSGYGKEAE